MHHNPDGIPYSTLFIVNHRIVQEAHSNTFFAPAKASIPLA
jgi:hypothetical protein